MIAKYSVDSTAKAVRSEVQFNLLLQKVLKIKCNSKAQRSLHVSAGGSVLRMNLKYNLFYHADISASKI